MKTKIAINGFGRIGRNAFKVAFERPDLEIVAVNDLTDTKTLAHLLKHDSNYGAYQHDVDWDEQNIIVNGQKIKVLSEKDPTKLPWRDLGVDIVIESTGLFTDPAKAKAHIEAGAKKVIISAPAKGEGAETIVLGVNEDKAEQAGEVISNASCTTNSITPIMAILEANFGIKKAMMTTIHSYTASQVLLDGPAKDIREARNAATNIVPTTTGASVAAAKALPTLEGVFGGMSIRVPTPVVSLSDFSVLIRRNTTVEEVNEVLKKAAADPYYQGIVDVTEEELVSSDFIGNSHSVIVDLKLTAVVGGDLVKVVGWYDNEWGYSNRLIELTADVGKLLASDQNEMKDENDTKNGPKGAHKGLEGAATADSEKEKPSTDKSGKESGNTPGADDQPGLAADVDNEEKSAPTPKESEPRPESVGADAKPYTIIDGSSPKDDKPMDISKAESLLTAGHSGEELLAAPQRGENDPGHKKKHAYVEEDHDKKEPDSLELSDDNNKKHDQSKFRHF